MRQLLFTAISLSLLATAAPSLAAPCRNAKGKFVKCPEKTPVKSTRCKAANGKFAKCGTPGAKPM